MSGNYEAHPWRVTRRGDRPQREPRLTMDDLNHLTENFLARRAVNEVFTPSPLLAAGSASNGTMRVPFQYAPPPRGGFMHTNAAPPIFEDAEDREYDLRRRLDEVREILGLTNPNREIRAVGFVEWDGDEAQGAPFPRTQHLSRAHVTRLRSLLSYEEVPHIVEPWDEGDTDTVFTGMVHDRDGESNRIVLTGADRLNRGTILDAAARPIRKFRIMQE